MWKPAGNGKSLEVDTPSRFMESMERAGYTLPCSLSEEDYDKLMAMAAVYGGKNSENPYHKLAEIVMDVGNIDVFSEW